MKTYIKRGQLPKFRTSRDERMCGLRDPINA